ncbi:MAG: FCD domain-containing protein [Roseibium sp.]
MTYLLPERVLVSLPTGAVKDTAESLGRRIVRGVYKTGTLLPKEDEFVTEFEVSRTVVREAIKVLSGKGLVRTARRYGSRVCEFSGWNLWDPDVIRWHDPDSPLTARIYSEAADLRCLFEPEAAALAAVNASQEQRDLILDAADKIYSLDDDPSMVGADYVFHATILEASGNMMLAQLQNLICSVLVFAYAAGAKSAPDKKVSRAKHIDVANAIASGDSEKARAGMLDMLLLNKVVAQKIIEIAASKHSS